MEKASNLVADSYCHQNVVQRQTIDLVISKEEEFGLFIAALRALMSELQALAAEALEATAVLPIRVKSYRRPESYKPAR